MVADPNVVVVVVRGDGGGARQRTTPSLYPGTKGGTTKPFLPRTASGPTDAVRPGPTAAVRPGPKGGPTVRVPLRGPAIHPR